MSAHDSCAHLSTTKGLVAKPSKTSGRSVSPPPMYQRVDPQISSAPVRPARPDRSQTLEDIFALYEYSDDVMPQPQPQFARKHTRKPALSLAVSSATSTALMTAGKPESAEIVSPPNSHFRSLCRDPLNTVLHSGHGSRYVPHIVVTPPQYREVDPHAVSEKPAPKRASKPFKLPVSRNPMDQWACQYTYRACAFLTARKASNMLRSPSAALIAALQPKALEWSDAAEPLLTWLGQFQSFFVLESQMPCTVPHIVLTEPSPDDGWAAYNNIAPQQNSLNGQILSLDWAPRAPIYQSVMDEEWCSSADPSYLELDSVFTFLDDDLDELPSPTRTENAALPTPPPYSESAWGAAASLNIKVEKDQGENVMTLSPTSGPGLPLFFAQGEASHFSHDFPSSIEFDIAFSPISPVNRTPFTQDWMQSVSMMVSV